MSNYIDFNINHYVHVKLTEIGKEELIRQAEELRNHFPEIKTDWKIPNEKDGWSKWQLWQLMSDLGHLCHNGLGHPFETTIRIFTKKENVN